MSNLIDAFSEAGEDQIRQRIFTLPDQSPKDEPLFKHQKETLQAIEQNNERSGIIKLPTSGGKTRIALEYMSRKIKEGRKFIWASYPTKLIRQSMVRLVELASAFPEGTTFAWFDSDWYLKRDLFEEVDILFVMRDHLTRMFELPVKDGRVKNSPLQRIYEPRGTEEEYDLSLIYDECHQLGARKLQLCWKKFTEKFDCSLHTLGLSATPLPTQEEQHYFLKDEVFPLPEDGSIRGAHPEWDMMCHYSLDRSHLIKRKVLCPINTYWQTSQEFDLHITPDLKPPPSSPTQKDISEFAEQFNSTTIEKDEILGQLSQDISENFEHLGKTLVFVPTIHAANKLAAFLRDYDSMKGKVSVVHSKLDNLDEKSTSKSKQTQEFINRGEENCLMINVGMLTTGFDDPNINTIILARLTFSTNLFWQMIGRGCRGPKVGGTSECYVIDPIRLTDKYGVLNGYRPSVAGKDSEYEKVGDYQESDEYLNEIEKEIITINEKPNSLSEDQEETFQYQDEVTQTLQEFINYRDFKDKVDKSNQMIDDDEEKVMNTQLWCLELIEKAEEETDNSYEWLIDDEHLPEDQDEYSLKAFHKKIRICKQNDINSKKEWQRYLAQKL